LQNSLFLNDGKGNFQLANLPHEMQYTSYYGGIMLDVNQDGQQDLIPCGNFYKCNVQMGRYDTENGGVLINKGNGAFDYLNLKNAPFKDQVKQMKTITIANQKALIVAQNDGPLKILKIK